MAHPTGAHNTASQLRSLTKDTMSSALECTGEAAGMLTQQGVAVCMIRSFSRALMHIARPRRHSAATNPA